MAKVYEFLADGFEDVEALAPLDILRRGGQDVKTVSIMPTASVTSAHGVVVKADLQIAEADLEDADLLVLPGGMPGAANLNNDENVHNALLRQAEKGGLIGAICAAPLVLGGLGLLQGRRATCYPGFEQYLLGADVTGELVTVDGNITTAKGPGAAFAFGYTLLRNFVGEEQVEQLKQGMIYQG